MQLNSTKYYALLLCCFSTSYTLFAKDAVLKEVQQNLAQTSQGFIENKGQVVNQYNKTRTDIQFDLKRPGVSLFLSAGVLHYQFNHQSGKGKNIKDNAYRMDVALIGANKAAAAVTSDSRAYTEQYSINGKMLTARSFGKVTYMNVYPGIDWAVYTKEGKVEYDFIVHPGADAGKIKLKYGGAASIHLSENGSLVIKTPSGEIKEQAPYTYALNTNEEIGSAFSLSGNTLSFNIAAHNGTIVIDPQLQWSTYFGGTSAEVLNAIATDAAGNVYACGSTTSAANIATSGAYQVVYNTLEDCFLVKFNASGVEQWATYFGGTSLDVANSVATDATGSVYICGQTYSTDLPTTFLAFQSVLGGINDAFLAKFNSAGKLQWSTYYGSTGIDNAFAVVCDKWRSVYIAGNAGNSTGNLASAGAFNTVFSGNAVGFIARFDTSGNRIWGTYYGTGTASQAIPQSLSTDPSGKLYICGYESNTTDMATINEFQLAQLGSGVNGFVAKFDSSDKRIWGSYFGGSGTYGTGIANDTLGNVYFTGYTPATSGIVSTGIYQPVLAGAYDAYLAKFDTAGRYKWATYFGGTGNETSKGLTIDNFGNPVIAGYTNSTTGITTTNNGTYQSVLGGGGTDEYIAKFTPLGQRLWSTYFGGTGMETGGCIANNANGGLYSAGSTTSVNAISTPGASQPANGGGGDGYISNFNNDTFVVISQPYIDTFLCPGGSFNLTYNASYAFRAGNTFTAQLSDANGSFATPVNISSSIIATATIGTIPVIIPIGTPLGNGYHIRIIASSPAYTSPDEFVNIRIVADMAQPTITSNSPVCVGDSIKLSAVNTSTIVPSALGISGPNGFLVTSLTGNVPFATAANAGVYTASITHTGCTAATATVNVVVNSVIPPIPSAISNSPICSGGSIVINASSTVSPVTYRITGPHGYVSFSQNPVINNADTSMTGYYFIVDTLNSCRSAKDSILVTVTPSVSTTLNVVATPGDTVCAGSGFSFAANATNQGNNPHYQWRTVNSLFGDTAVVGATSNIYASNFLSSGDIVYCILNSAAQCLSNPLDTSNKVQVTILQPYSPVINIAVSPGNMVAPGTPLVFTSALVQGGVYNSYQWYVNGQPVLNDTLATATFHSLSDNDIVTLIVHNHVQCAAPDSAISNAIQVHISTGVSQVGAALNTLTLYPNPTKGKMSLTGHLDGLASKTVQLEVLNAIGQLVYTNTVTVNNGVINEPVTIGTADGTYLLRIKADGESRVIRFTLQR